MQIAGQCCAQGCDQPSIIEIDLRRVCLLHFITTCERRLGELSENMQPWPLDQIAWETADRFTKECIERGTNISRNQPAPTIPERTRLLEIIFWASQLGKQLRGSR
jgi:hypothetical protein